MWWARWTQLIKNLITDMYNLWSSNSTSRLSPKTLLTMTHNGKFHLFFSFFFFGCPEVYGVPRPGIRSELQLWQCWILNPLCWAGDQTWVPVLPRHCQSCRATAGNPKSLSYHSSKFSHIFLMYKLTQWFHQTLWMGNDNTLILFSFLF